MPTKHNTHDLIAAYVRRAILDSSLLQCRPSVDSDAAMQLFCSPAAEAIKQEIVRAGKKLWDRQYVDGNGGNISARISDSYVICTPTLCSKGDLRAEELALVDLENNKIVGCRPQTSEILLHLEIYKLVPKAKAIIHCHPPYATAHAIAGTIPPGNLVPEQEVFIGPVAFAPYETPGTLAFARTVLPFAKRHNTCLLANHGIVTWSDSVTHAEWNVEVLETFCKTVTIASQLGNSLQEIPPDKLALLLDFKKTWGLPDARFPEDSGCEEPTQSYACDISEEIHPPAGQSQLEELVSKMTEQVIGYLKLEQ